MTNILITGGAGNVGSALANKLVQNENNQVVVVDNLRTGSIQKLPNSNLTNFKFIKADVNNFIEIEKIMKEIDFQYIFHYAALVGVQRTLDNPLDVLNDIEGFKNILELSKMSSVKKIFFSSSSEVYGDGSGNSMSENDFLKPKSIYGHSKIIGEELVKTYSKIYNISYNICRFFNIYGENQRNEFVIPKFIKQIQNGESLEIYGSGQQLRCFCHVEDACNAVLKILRYGKKNQTYNIGNNNEPIKIHSLAKLLIKKSKKKLKIKKINFDKSDRTKNREIYFRKPNLDKIYKDTGYYAKIKLLKFVKKNLTN